MATILFVCTGNQFRSPIAAAFLNRLLGNHGFTGWSVGSAGTWAIPKLAANEEAIRDAKALGLNLRAHVTRMVDADMLQDADLIVVMEKGQLEALLTEFPESGPRMHLLADLVQGMSFNIPDPVAYPGEHDKVLHEMCDVIDRAFPRIVELAQCREAAD